MISGEPSIIVAILTGAERPMSHPMMLLMRISIIFTCVVLTFTEIFARISKRISNAMLTSPSIANSLPFSTLNLSFALGIVFQVLANTVFSQPVGHYGIGMSLILPLLLWVNKQARKHLLTRLRQCKESRFVGRRNGIKHLATFHDMANLYVFPLMIPTLGAYPYIIKFP